MAGPFTCLRRPCYPDLQVVWGPGSGGCFFMTSGLLAEAGGHWAWGVLGLLAVPALVALNAFFVATEFALVAVRKTRVEEMVRHGVRGARAVEDAIAHLDRSIA